MVLVEVAEGTLEGVYEENEYGGGYYSFNGVPYAEPPVGELRFKSPQTLKPWKGVRSAKELAPKCYQIDFVLNDTEPSGSEDCLYLNVHTPNLKPDKPLPVMVWIHGGGLFFGNTSDYTPTFLIRHDVVLVGINYRILILGFLCLDIEEVPGNAGMKDQVAALRWVKQNIRNFGGDPENITVFGASSGGDSVSYHLISPMTKGLFKRAIPQSGTCISQWSFINDPREKAIAFARSLGFTSTDPYEIYEFLKSFPAESLMKFNVPVTFDELAIMPGGINFGFVSEKKFGNNEVFFSGDVFDDLRQGIHEDVDVMTGFTEQEGVFGVLSRGLFDNISKSAEFLEFFCPTELRYHCTKKQILEVGRLMRTRYLQNDLISKEKVWSLVNYWSMEDYKFNAIRWLKFVAKSSKNKFYLYKFSCRSDLNVITDFFNLRELLGPGTFVSHADDFMYLFFMTPVSKKIGLDSEAFKIMDKVTKIWTDFAKYGDPTPDGTLGARWAPYTVERQEYMDVGEQLTPGTEPERDEMEFWESVYKKYLPEHLP